MSEDDNEQSDVISSSDNPTVAATRQTLNAARGDAHRVTTQAPSARTGRGFRIRVDSDGSPKAVRDDTELRDNQVPLTVQSAQSANTLTTVPRPVQVDTTQGDTNYFDPEAPLNVHLNGYLAGQLQFEAATAFEVLSRIMPDPGQPATISVRFVSTLDGIRAEILSLDQPPFHPSNVPVSATSSEQQTNLPSQANTLPNGAIPPRPASKPSRVRPRVSLAEPDWTRATEQPTGDTKAETDSCLTCISVGRKCKGTILVKKGGDVKCGNCGVAYTSTEGKKTGTRRCYWKDEANNIFTLQQAKEFYGHKCQVQNTAEYKKAKAKAKDLNLSVEEVLQSMAAEEGVSVADLLKTFGLAAKRGSLSTIREATGYTAVTADAVEHEVTGDKTMMDTDQELETNDELNKAVNDAWMEIINDVKPTVGTDYQVDDGPTALVDRVGALIETAIEEDLCPWSAEVLAGLRARLAQERGNAREKVDTKTT